MLILAIPLGSCLVLSFCCGASGVGFRTLPQHQRENSKTPPLFEINGKVAIGWLRGYYLGRERRTRASLETAHRFRIGLALSFFVSLRHALENRKIEKSKSRNGLGLKEVGPKAPREIYRAPKAAN